MTLLVCLRTLSASHSLKKLDLTLPPRFSDWVAAVATTAGAISAAAAAAAAELTKERPFFRTARRLPDASNARMRSIVGPKEHDEQIQRQLLLSEFSAARLCSSFS